MECWKDSGIKLKPQSQAILNQNKKTFNLMEIGGLNPNSFSGIIIEASLRDNIVIVKRHSSALKRVKLKVRVSNSRGYSNTQIAFINF